MENIPINDMMEIGLQQAQTHYGKKFISVTDAVEFYHTKHNRNDALPSLSLVYALISQDNFRIGLDKRTKDGFTETWKESLMQRWRDLPE